MARLALPQGKWIGFIAGTAFGAVAAALLMVAMFLTLGQPNSVRAGCADRYQDYVMATGAVNLGPKTQADGVWMLDYRAGKLLGTVVDKTQGKIVGWAEVDLVAEFKVTPRQDVHFMMVTGFISSGQSALYVAETTTGKFGVYTMGGGANGSGVVIRRHDLTNFRHAEEPTAGTTQPSTPSTAPVAAHPGGNVIQPVQGLKTTPLLPPPSTTMPPKN